LRSGIRRRDRRRRLECEVGYFLIHICGVLADEFPDAKFICTVRPPQPWLRSIVNQCINNSRSNLREAYRWLRDYSFGSIPDDYASWETPLSRFNLHSLGGYLSYWDFHYRTVLETLSSERCLFLRTKDLSKAPERIANFVGVPPSDLRIEQSHAHKTSEKHGVLDEIDDEYLAEMIGRHCREVANRLTQETGVSINL
jgi:hypothetical protein